MEENRTQQVIKTALGMKEMPMTTEHMVAFLTMAGYEVLSEEPTNVIFLDRDGETELTYNVIGKTLYDAYEFLVRESYSRGYADATHHVSSTIRKVLGLS